MIFIRIQKMIAITPMFLAAMVYAQDSGTPVEAAADDEAITILNQVVPVAEDEPAEDELAEVGPPEEELPAINPDYDQINERELMLAAFERFRELKTAGSLDEAENLAKRMIELSIRISGPTSLDTSKALNNLAVVQHETGDYEAAQQNFNAAIEIIEDNEDQLNSLLINPLRGLGASQLQSGRPDLASRTYRRAVHISHVNEGPHNLDQIEILEALAETNLRLGDTEEAKDNHDMIYALNVRHYSGNAINMIPALLRRAAWQRRTGYILDERATYRRIIRIVESQNGKDDITLVGPLMRLGESYFFVDTSESQSFQAATAATGEMYFKRAVRIAEEHPDSDWATLAKTKLALGDYYNFRSDLGRAQKSYRESWEILSTGDEQLAIRKKTLEVVTSLNDDPIPRYVGEASSSDRQLEDNSLREGRVLVTYNVNTRGRVSELKIVEATPVEFDDMRRFVQREMRSRIYRPRFEDAEPVESRNQALTHTFFYRQEELDQLREEAKGEQNAASGKESDSG
jgi:tetratricopeptide (TPR) repeat protein